MEASAKRDLESDCEYILQKLLRKHKFLQPSNPDYDVWSKDDAAEIVADLILAINNSSEIEYAHNEHDWGR